SAENSRSNFVWNVFSQNSVARQSAAIAFPSLTPSLIGAVSRKIRSSDSATIDLPLNLGGGNVAVESRAGGPTQLVLTFGANIVKGPNFAVSLSSGAVSSSTVSGSTLTINLSGATNAQTLTVNMTDIRNTPTSASGSYTLHVGVLLGDANGSATVDTVDFNILAANFGQGGKLYSDGEFNSDGTVDSLDFAALAGNFGKTVATMSAAAEAARAIPLRAQPTLSFPMRIDEDDAVIDALLDNAGN